MNTIPVLVKLSEVEIAALAEFLERVRYEDYLHSAMDRERAFTMLEAGAKVYCVLRKIERVRRRDEKMATLAALYRPADT